MDRENKVKEYVAQLESNPYDLAPMGRLEEAFDNGEKGVADLVALFEERAPEVGSEDAAARLYLEAARMASTGLNDLDRSHALLAQSLAVGEDTRISVEAYLFQFAMQDENEELQDFFAEALAFDSDEMYQSRLYQRMGCILADFVGDLEQADTAYQYALDLDPGNMAALWSRRVLAQKQSAWGRLAELLIEEIERSEEPLRQAELSVMVGGIYRDYLDSLDSAEQCFAFAYEQDPNNAEAIEALRDMGYEIDVDEVEADLPDDPPTMDLDEDMLIDEENVEEELPEIPVEEDAPMTMELDEEMLIDEEPAEDGLPEIPVEEEEDAPMTMELDEEMLIDEQAVEDELPEIPVEAEESEVEEGEELELAEESEVEEEAEELELAEESEVEEEAEELELTEESEAEVEELELAEESEELGIDESSEAEEEGEELELAEESEVEEEAEELELAEESEAEEEADAAAERRTWRDRFEELLAQAAEADQAIEPLVWAAELQSRHREDTDDAVRIWRTAMDAGVAIDLYDKTHFLYVESEFWSQILGLVDEVGIDGADELKAQIHLFKLSDVDAAQEIAEASGIESIQATLDQLEEAESNWRKFQRALEKEHDDLGDDEKALLVYLRMADLAAAMGDAKKEIDALRRLERQVDDERVQSRLKILYRESEKWPMYVDLLKKEAEALGDDRLEDKVDILNEVIRVYREDMNHDRMAINVYKEILELAPDNLNAIDDLIGLYDEMNMSSDLITMLQQKAELVQGDAAKVEIYGDIARLFLEKFRNQAEAIKAYETVLEIEPYHSEAISFLKEMYEKRRDWESLIEVHQREIETFDSDEEQAAGLKEVAELATERLRDPDVASDLWLDVRQVAPEDADALDALEKLYEKKRDYEALGEILEQKVPLTEDATEQMKLYQKLGMLYSDRLEDSERAIAAWRGALDLEPDDLKARKALERLYIDNQMWDELEEFYAEADGYSDLVRILGTLTGRADDEAVTLELLLRSARIWREELDDTSRAERELERVLEIDAENEEAAAQLEPIYLEAEDYPRLKDVLEIVLAHLEESEQRKEYQLKLGRLHRDQFDDWSEAFGWFAQAFREQPAEVDVIEELEAAAEHAEGAWPQLVDHYRDALGDELEGDEELQLRLLLGRVLSEEVEDLDAALEQFQAVLDVEEDNLNALAAMEGIFRRSERWEELMKVYRHRLELEDDIDARVSILQGMAHIAEAEAQDTVTAIARYNEALELDRRNTTTLAELHRLYRGEEDYADLAEVIRQEIDVIERRARTKQRQSERRVVDASQIIGDAGEVPGESMFGDVTPDADEKVDDVLADLHEEVGESSDAFEDGAEVDADGEVAAAESQDAEALEEVDDVEEAVESDDGGPEALDDVDMERPAFYVEEEVEALTALRFELGVVCKEHLGEVEEAVAALGKVLTWRPGHLDARTAVESLLEDSLYKSSVAAILEPVYEVHGVWESLVDVLEIQADATDDAEEERELHRRVGAILLEEIGDGERAFESYGRVLSLNPADEDGRTQLYRIAHELELWDRFVDLLEEIVPSIEDEDLRVEYFYTLGGVNGEYREEYDEARRYLEEVYALRPDEVRALDDLEELFISTEAWRDLLDVIDRKIEFFDDPEKVEALYFRKARVWEELLEDSHQAIAIFEQILENDPENLRAYSHLDNIYEYEGMWHELAADLETELELVDESERHTVKNRLAQVLEAHLDDSERAVDLYEEVLEEDSANPAANEAMEELMRREDGPRGRVSRILEPLYIERGDAELLIEALEVQVQESVDPDDRVELLHRIAALHEDERGDMASAFQTYARALSDDVSREDTLDHLYRLATEADGFQELIDVFENEAQEQTDPSVQRDMLRRSATLYIDPLAEIDLATERLHAVLELFPADLETVEELEEIYRQTQEWAELVSILVTKAELVEDLDQRKDLFHQAGTLYEDILDGPHEAIEIYNRALAIDEADVHSIDRLEVLYTSLERWHDLLEVYRRKLDLADDDDAKKDLLYVIGAIYQEHLEHPQDAIETYRRVLEIDPEERGSLEKLDELFEFTEQWHELLEILEQQLNLADDVEEEETLKYRIGRLWEVHLNDGHRAVEVFEEVLAANPEHRASIEALEGMVERGENEVDAARVLQPLYQDKGQWERLVHIHRLLIDAAHDIERKVSLYKEVAAILEERLEDPAEAFATYVEALEVEPGRVEIQDTLERLAADLDGWEILIEQLDAVLENITDFEVVTALQLRVARIFEEELQQPQSAIERFQRVLEVEPGQSAAILALDRLYQHQGQWEDLGEILKSRIYNSDDPAEALELRLRLGMLQQTALEDAGAAIASYQEVLLEEPENAAAIEALEQMFMDGSAVERIADILEPFYLERGQHDKVVEIYLQRLEMLDDPFQRFDLLMQVARIFLDELQDVEQALQTYGAALRERPDDEQVLSEIERLSEMTMEWGAAAEIYADALESEQNTDDSSLGLWLRLARVLDQKMEAFEDAELGYQKVLELDPAHEEALKALDRIYQQQARWADLAEILERRIAETFDEFEVVDLNYRLAQIFQDQLGDFEQAVATYERILQTQPDHQESLQHLEQIHTALQAWEPLFDVLQRRSQLTHDPDEQADFFSRMAQLAEEMLERKDDAVDLWQRVTEVRPDDMNALGELRRLYLEDERWNDLVSVLRREVELSQDPEERLGLFESLGTIYGGYLHDEVQAQDCWLAVLEIDPVHLEALESLKDLTTRQADYQQLAEIIERLIAHEEVAQERKLSLWEELGEVQGDMLMNPAAAIDAWQNVLSLNPEHERALDELEQLYLQESRWEEAANILDIKSDRVADDEDRIELLTRQADIWEAKLFESSEAIRSYQRILEIDPMHMVASQSLEAIYQEQGTEEAFGELAGLYLDRADIVEDPFERIDVMRNAARIFEENLMQPENAFVVLLSVVGPETLRDENLMAEIERLARQTEMWQEAVENFQGVVEELGDTPEAADLHRRIGGWLAQELGQPDDAVYHLQMAKMIEPDNVQVLETLERLYQDLSAWPELAQILQTRVELSNDPDEQVELWRKLGELYEMQMGDIDEAITAYNEILLVDPSDILAMECLERVFEAFERWPELVEILQQKSESTYDPDLIVEIKSRAAQIWEDQLHEVDQAITAYREVLAVDQSHVPSLQALERLYTESEHWHELVDVYEQQLALTHEPDEQVLIYGKMASVHENQFQDLERAVEAYTNVLMVDPNNLTAIESLERLYRDLERWFELVDTLRRHIELVDGVSQQVSLYTELGQLQRDEVGDPHAAIEAFEKAVELEPVHPGLWSELAELHESTSNWERAVEAYDRLVEQLDDDDTRVEVYFRLGGLLVGQLHDHASGEEAYMSALRLDPRHSGVIDAVRDLLSMQQHWDSLIRVLKLAEDAERELDEKAVLLAEIGTIYEKHVGDEVNALRYYEEALEQNPRLTAAALPLTEVYIREQRFERAVPLLEMALEEYGTSVDVEDEERHRRHLQLARAYQELAQPDQALQQFRYAYELVPTDQDTLEGLGQLLYEREEWEQASKVLQSLQLHHEDKLERSQLVEVYFRLGAIRQKLNDLRKAGDYFDRALEVEQHHLPTLERRIEVSEGQEKWDEVVRYTRWLLETADDPKLRFAQLSRIGDLLGAKLNRPPEAVAAYEEALELEPNSVVVLRKLLDLYTKTKQWHEAVGILMRIIEQEDNASRIAKYYYTAAVIYRNELEDPTEAVKLFNKALDADAPSMLKAFEAIDRILTTLKSWRELARNYRKMLHRVNERDDEKMEYVKVQLWQNLGEVYRTRMGDFETAIEAYKIAVGLKEDDEKMRLILAELYEKAGTHPEGVIEQHRELIKLDRFRVESYRKLFKSYIETKKYDRAWCMAGALSFLQSASEQEETFFKKYLGASLPAAQSTFNQEMVKKIYHTDQDALITYIMSVIGQGLRPVYSVSSIKDWGVHKRKDKVDLEERVPFNKIYSYVAQTINLLPAPRVYLKGDQALGMRNANVDPQAVIIGGDVRQKSNDRELAFIAAKSLTWMLPQHYMGSIGQPTEFLKMYFMALMDMTNPSLGLAKTMGEQGAAAKAQLAELPPPMLMQAQKAMQKFLEKGENPNLSQWLKSAEHTAIRMGLLLSGDIHTAAACIKSDLVPIGKAGVKDKIREMVLFSISEEYFELREELGLAIGK